MARFIFLRRAHVEAISGARNVGAQQLQALGIQPFDAGAFRHGAGVGRRRASQR